MDRETNRAKDTNAEALAIKGIGVGGKNFIDQFESALDWAIRPEHSLRGWSFYLFRESAAIKGLGVFGGIKAFPPADSARSLDQFRASLSYRCQGGKRV